MAKKKMVKELPKCNFCGTDALYDTPTIHNGSWAYLCKKHSKIHATHGQLATGFIFEKIDPTIPKSSIKEVLLAKEISDMEEITFGDGRDVECPVCGTSRSVEPDAAYEFQCEGCGQQLQCQQIM